VAFLNIFLAFKCSPGNNVGPPPPTPPPPPARPQRPLFKALAPLLCAQYRSSLPLTSDGSQPLLVRLIPHDSCCILSLRNHAVHIHKSIQHPFAPSLNLRASAAACQRCQRRAFDHREQQSGACSAACRHPHVNGRHHASAAARRRAPSRAQLRVSLAQRLVQRDVAVRGTPFSHEQNVTL
jgi:hypothetical protein